MSDYIAEKGYKSKSHYLAIRRWVIDAVKERKQRSGKKTEKPKQNFEGVTYTEEQRIENQKKQEELEEMKRRAMNL